jgi:hypothetical protein
MPCCGKTPFEVPTTDGLTINDREVTCPPPEKLILECRASQYHIDTRHTCGLSGKMFFQAEPHAHQGEQCVDWAHCTRTSDQQNGGPSDAAGPVN